MTIQGWSVDLKIAQIELQWGGCRSIREILMLEPPWLGGAFRNCLLGNAQACQVVVTASLEDGITRAARC